jgi:hypothetical protein
MSENTTPSCDTSDSTDATVFQDYVGRSEVLRTRIAEAPVALLAALLDRRFDEVSPDGALPALWHLLIVPAPVRQSEIGPDGHPKRGTFLPPITYPRRMFAGSKVRFIEPLYVGDEVVRTTTIRSITPKAGRSGNLIFVTIAHTIEGSDLRSPKNRTSFFATPTIRDLRLPKFPSRAANRPAFRPSRRSIRIRCSSFGTRPRRSIRTVSTTISNTSGASRATKISWSTVRSKRSCSPVWQPGNCAVPYRLSNSVSTNRYFLARHSIA